MLIAIEKRLSAGMTLCGALPVALLVKSPAVLALVSQASVSFVFLFAVVVAVMSLSPSQSHSKSASCCLSNRAVFMFMQAALRQ